MIDYHILPPFAPRSAWNWKSSTGNAS